MKLLKIGSRVHTRRMSAYVADFNGRGPRDRIRVYVFVAERAVDDPSCARDDNDPTSAFAQYLLPRIHAGKDQASKEVREYLKVEGMSDAVAHTIQSLPVAKTRHLRAWTEEALSSRVYKVVKMILAPAVSEVVVESEILQLRLTKGGPRDEFVWQTSAILMGDELRVKLPLQADQHEAAIDRLAIERAELLFNEPIDVAKACKALRESVKRAG